MKKSTSPDKDFELWWLIRQTTHLMERVREKELGKHGLTIVQAGILFSVQLLGQRATPAELARWQAREPHTISGVLNGMVRKGLVKKVKDLHHKNMVRVAMTEKGKRIYSEVSRRESIYKMLSALPEEGYEQLQNNMKTLRARTLELLGTSNKSIAPPFS